MVILFILRCYVTAVVSGLLIFLTPSGELADWVHSDPALTFVRNEITRLIYRYEEPAQWECSTGVQVSQVRATELW